MNNMLKYTKMLLLFVLVLGLTSCDSEEETEYNLPVRGVKRNAIN